MSIFKGVKTRKFIFWSGIAGNISILCSLKYLNTIILEINSLFVSDLGLHKGLVLIGISYYTFQAISYLTDIYLGIEEPEHHLGYFALYMAFFPKLLQGPIERSGDLLPQLKQPYKFNYDDVRTGMLQFAWGLFKKVAVADRLAGYVNPVFNNVHGYSGLIFVLITYLYALQIFFDFSGYTDMALGSARIFNIKLTQNFNSPYLATSVADFWRRWHISFSRWILDYIFKPLQMQWRNGKSWGTASALLIAFCISGLWHGASWGFAIWGLLHGAYLASSVFYKPVQKRIHKKLGLEKTAFLRCWQTAVTFNLICFAWVFFRSNSVADALYIIESAIIAVPDLFTHPGYLTGLVGEVAVLYNGSLRILMAVFAVMALLNIFIKNNLILGKPIYVRWSLYSLLILTVLFFGNYDNSRFIYYKF